MRKFLVLLLLSFLCTACPNPNDDGDLFYDIVNKWVLVEVYNDPGDGSGDFVPIQSTKTLEFTKDFTFTASESLCFGTDDTIGVSGSYEVNTERILPEGCYPEGPSTDVPEYVITYFIDGEFLILQYPCIEACSEKYRVIFD